MKIKRQEGFTMVELLVVVGITGILMATAVPVYRTWQGRAYGSEAAIMIKQILDAEILYYLEHDKFYPDQSDILILHKYDPDHANVKDIEEKLNIIVPTGHFLDYTFSSYDDEGVYTFQLSINSINNQFEIFKDVTNIAYKMDKDGNISTFTF